PTTIKDIFYTRGVPTLRGSRLLADKPDAAEPGAWPDDAPVTSAVHEAGCVVIGKTTTPEFAWKGVTDNPVTGVTRNPYDPALTPGGSSGGGSAARGAGLGQRAPGAGGRRSLRDPRAVCRERPLRPGAHPRRLQWRGLGGRRRGPGPARPGHRRRRLGPDPRRVLRDRRPQADVRCHPDVPVEPLRHPRPRRTHDPDRRRHRGV